MGYREAETEWGLFNVMLALVRQEPLSKPDYYQGIYFGQLVKPSVDRRNIIKSKVSSYRRHLVQPHVVANDRGGKKAYLCSSMCKSEFDSNPSKYGY